LKVFFLITLSGSQENFKDWFFYGFLLKFSKSKYFSRVTFLKNQQKCRSLKKKSFEKIKLAKLKF